MMTDQQFQRIAKALADPRRFQVMQRVAATDGEVACQALRDEFTIAAATMSHHLKELEVAGLVRSRHQGQQKILTADRGTITRYQRELARRLSRST
jgi:ArsR family transcriptional regulator, arsenate/arsenite/antimonite-responsive transcriptional repressor